MPWWTDLFGGGGAAQAEQGNPYGPGGGQGAAQAQQVTLTNNAIQTGAAMQLQQAAIQQQAYQGTAGGNLQYQTVIRNPYADFWDNTQFGEYRTVTQTMLGNQMAFGRAHTPEPVDAMCTMGNAFLAEGLEFTEIVVNRHTYERLRIQIGVTARRWAPNELPAELQHDIIINTAMGPVKIVCQDRKPVFDLSQYMETVE